MDPQTAAGRVPRIPAKRGRDPRIDPPVGPRGPNTPPSRQPRVDPPINRPGNNTPPPGSGRPIRVDPPINRPSNPPADGRAPRVDPPINRPAPGIKKPGVRTPSVTPVGAIRPRIGQPIKGRMNDKIEDKLAKVAAKKLKRMQSGNG